MLASSSQLRFPLPARLGSYTLEAHRFAMLDGGQQVVVDGLSTVADLLVLHRRLDLEYRWRHAIHPCQQRHRFVGSPLFHAIFQLALSFAG